MNGTKRNMTIYEMRDNGATFADIAREFGISTERARQIYVAHKAMEERDGTPMYRALCEAAEDAGRPYPERAASRAYHYLVRSGITELAQLADYSDSQLLKIRCFGICSLEIARAAQAKAVPTEGAQVEEPAQIDFDGVLTVEDAALEVDMDDCGRWYATMQIKFGIDKKQLVRVLADASVVK